MAVLSPRPRQLIFILAAVAGLPLQLATAQEQLTESVIKAGFLYNFTKFVEWPSETFANATVPLELGIVGSNPFGSLLLDAAAKPVNGRPVRIKQFGENADLRSCQILFVSWLDKKHIVQILQTLKGTSVLTVGEGEGFTQAGGMIAFVIEGGKVRLAINLEAASDSRIKISAKVIAVARLVGRQPQGNK